MDMDGFGDNFGDVDPAAEFLAREQNDLAGLEDDLKPTVPIVQDGFDNLSGGSPPNGSFGVVSNDDEPFANDVTNNNDEVFGNDEQDTVFPSEPAAIPGNKPVVVSTPKATPPQVRVPREEPEKIKLWREDQKRRLEEKDLNEEKKKEEWRDAAKKEMEEWYRHHEDLVAKTKATNRNAEKEQVAEDDEIVPGTEWERIAKLCDFNPKASKSSKDVSRMRSIILQLKQTPLQPKA